MNELIKRLAAKAGAPRADYPYETVVLTTVEIQKFAELIVQECCTMVNNHVQLNNPNDCPMVLDIKDHFGVK